MNVSEVKRPILILSLPRSGSTWAASVLSQCVGTKYISEPADAYRWPAALWAKFGLAEYPTQYDALTSSRYQKLWSTVLSDPSYFDENRFGTRLLQWIPPPVTRLAVKPRRSNSMHAQPDAMKLALPPKGDRLIVKDVTIPLCGGVIADWLGAEVLVLRRDPKKVVASWAKIGFPPEPLHLQSWVKEEIDRLGIFTPVLTSHAEQLAWTVGLLDLILMREAEARQWPVFSHERLITAPKMEYEDITRMFGLNATEKMWNYLADSMRAEGIGYSTNRTMEQLQNSSRGVFHNADEEKVARVLHELAEFLPSRVGV